MPTKTIPLNPIAHFDERLDRLEQLILQMQASASPTPAKKYLNATQAALYVGLSLQTIYFLCSEEGQRRNPAIPFHKPAKKLLFIQSELDTWLTKDRLPTQEARL